MSREQFNELIGDLVLRTIDMTNDIFDETKKRNIKIDAIVLSGGSSQIPIIKQSLEEIFEAKVPIHGHRPSSAVSFGAARYAYGEKIRIEEENRKRKEKEKEEEKRRKAEEEKRRRQIEEDRHKHEMEMARLRDETEKKQKEEEYRREKEQEIKFKELEERLKKELQEQLHVETKTRNSSTVLEQVTDYSYGIWIPSQENLAGEVFMLVKAGEKLPVKSSKIKLGTADFETTIKLYRSKNKGSFSRIVDIENMAQSILWPKFSTEAGSTCEVSIIVKEDYNIDIICELENGTRMVKSTADDLGKLYN